MQDLKQPTGSGLKFVCAVLTLLLWAASTFAQTGLGTVTGTVRDANNAVIRGANITLTQTATNIARKAVSNEEGVFFFTSVPIGAHVLAIEASGFKKWESKLTVMVGQQSVIEAAMAVGSTQDTVTVTDAAPLVQTESAEVSDIKDYQRIRQLPLNGRNVSTLFDLTPGIEGGGNARVNGLKVGSLWRRHRARATGVGHRARIPCRNGWFRRALFASGNGDVGNTQRHE